MFIIHAFIVVAFLAFLGSIPRIISDMFNFMIIICAIYFFFIWPHEKK